MAFSSFPSSIFILVNFRYDSIVSIPQEEDPNSSFTHKEICIFELSRVRISGLIEFAVCPLPNFLYPPVPEMSDVSTEEVSNHKIDRIYKVNSFYSLALVSEFSHR